MIRLLSFPLLSLWVACLFSFTASAQSTWTAEPSGVNSHLLGIHFPDETTGYVVGTNGIILKTNDGGDTWSAPLPSQTTDAFYAVFFTDVLTGFAVGDNGLIRQTTDGGDTWNMVTPPQFAYYRNVWFLDAQTGFIVGGYPDQDVMLKTTDGGATWNALPPTGNSQAIYGIYFTDANTGYATDFNGNILRTFDGGFSWNIQSASGSHLNSITFTDSYTGYAVGRDGVILKTTDAGNSWFGLNSGTNYFLSDVKFSDANTGFIVGGDVAGNLGIILKTTDGGNTWIQENFDTGTSSRQYRLFLPSANTAISCGLDGTIFKTIIADPYCCDDLQNSLFDAAFTYDPSIGQFCAPASVHPMDLLIWDLGDGNTATWWGSETCFGHTYAAPGNYLVTLIVERQRPDGKVCRVKIAQLVSISAGSSCDQCTQHLNQIYNNINVAVDMTYWNGPGSSVVFYPLPDFGSYQVRISWDVNCDGTIDGVTYGNQAFEYGFLCGQQSICYAIECLQDEQSACWSNWFSKTFNMPCFEQQCSCDDLVCDVNNGFSTWEYYSNQMQFTPNSLTPCDKVTWAWGDGTADVSAGNDPIWHAYPAPGNYFVCMIVTRTLPDGSTCQMRKYCTSVYLSGYFTAPENDGQEQKLGIFPNPGAGQFTVSLPHEFDEPGIVLQISSAEGKMMHSIPVEAAEMHLNLEDLPAGMYLLTICDGQGQRLGGAKRFVKQ